MIGTLVQSLFSPAPKNIFVFDNAALQASAEPRKNAYAAAKPFPHAVIDDFLPLWAAERLLSVFPAPEAPFWFDHKTRDPVYQPGKQGVGNAGRLEGADPFIHNILFAFNSHPFICFLETLTGVRNLLPDPHLHGGGLHQILPGGKLDIHADFNYHDGLMLYRRLNVLLYLNKDWKPEYGGDIELWNSDMTRCVQKVAPLFNRMVVFSTHKTSFHGHPEPLACPPDRTRKSMALYYYTRDYVDDDLDHHSTLWQKRPGEL